MNAEEEKVDAEFEQVVELVLTELPETLGWHCGRVLQQVLAYGDFSGWGTEVADAQQFRAAFENGMACAMKDGPIPEDWPQRAEVIAGFAGIEKYVAALPTVATVLADRDNYRAAIAVLKADDQ